MDKAQGAESIVSFYVNGKKVNQCRLSTVDNTG